MRFRLITSLFLLGLSAGPVLSQGLAGPYLAASRANIEGDFLAAADFYAAAVQADPENPLLRQNALVSYISAGEFQLARGMAETFSPGQNLYADLVLMTDQAAKGNYQSALDILPKDNPAFASLLSGLIEGWLEVGVGNSAQGYAIFDSQANNDSIRIYGQYHKALAMAYNGELEEALAIIDADGEPLHLNRNSVRAHAEILSALGRNEEALAILNTVGIRGTDGELFNNLRSRIEAGETLAFEQIAAPAHGMAGAFLMLGEALTREDPNRLGLFYTRLAQQLRPDFVETLITTAGILEREGQYTLAAETFARVPAGSAFYKDAVIGRADTLRPSGDIDGATETLIDLADRYPNDINVLNALGDIYRGVENWVDAANAYTRAIDNLDNPQQPFWVLFYTRGISYERTDQWPLAESDFRTALELSPDQPAVLNYLGYSYVEKGINLEEAQQMIETAVAGDPNNGYIRDSLAWVLYRLGKFEEAVPHMERAAQQLPLDPVINDHLGDVLWKVGRKTEARFQWRRALSFEPEDADLERIKRKLEVGLDQVLDEEATN